MVCNMKKVLYIANYNKGIGGISGQVEQLYNNVSSEANYEVSIFSTRGNVVRRFKKFIELLFVAKKYDVLHIHGCSYRGMLPIVYGIIVGKILKKHIIITYHGGDADKYFANHGAFARRWLNRADKVIVLNGYLKNVFDKNQIPCVVIPNIVQLPKIERTHRWNQTAPRFISVRHLRELYNIPCILRAFQQVQRLIPDASLTILGRGPQLAELQQFVIDEGLKHVTFVGQVPNQEMNTYLSEHDVFLSAPRVDNMPVSVLEAMNARLLVISSRVGGVPYLIDDGRTGLLFEYDDDKQMVEQILWANEHIDDVNRIVEAAHEEVKKYSWNNIKDSLLPLYE